MGDAVAKSYFATALLVLRLKNVAPVFGNWFYFIYKFIFKFIKFEYRNPKFETIGRNDLKKEIQNKEQTQPISKYHTVLFEYYFLSNFALIACPMKPSSVSSGVSDFDIRISNFRVVE
ncbi:MAG: hypothetical protein U5L00_02800 [Desulfovermiculus sp.]|nr:hypothetical protein [Desulfovermiculus sp.]